MEDATPTFDRCTISMDNRLLCGDSVIKGSPIPICASHAAMLLAFVNRGIDEHWAAELPDISEMRKFDIIAAMANGREARRRKTDEARLARNSVVYYVRVGEMVKIGFTTRLTARLSAYPPGSTLLATEPGDLALEAQRHQQFADALVAGNEWFATTRRLMAHIAALKTDAA